MYYTGTGVALDYWEAAKWVRLAAEQGHASGQADLAFLYEHGKGVPLDYANAYMWYRVAQEGGDKRAPARLKSIEQVMTQAQIQKASAAAEQLSRTLPKNTGTSNSVPIQNSFVDFR
jgi:TPR repeat protein